MRRGFPPGLRNSSLDLVWCKTALGVGDERVTGAFFFDGEKGLIGFGGSRTVQAFARAALVVIDGRQQVIAGDVVEENGSGFAAALQAYIKFRGGLGEK